MVRPFIVLFSEQVNGFFRQPDNKSIFILAGNANFVAMQLNMKVAHGDKFMSFVQSLCPPVYYISIGWSFFCFFASESSLSYLLDQQNVRMIIKELPVVIETPKGSSEKYDFDPSSRFFVLSKILPAGMVFPYDFGFILGTRGADGDPLDVMVISEFKSFPGCLIKCRLLGAIKAEQRERDGTILRNDRYIAVPVVSKAFKGVDAVSAQTIREIEHFFVSYNEQEGKQFTPLGYIEAAPAYEQIKFPDK
jgi:inorganic pyrophosphatase